MLKVDEQILADIGRGFSVPAQPGLLLELQGLINTPEPNLNHIAEVIAKDVAISATIIKTINSPLYGLARTIADIPKSVRYIGLTGITSLVTSNLIRKSFDQNRCSIELEDFWENTTNIANTAVYIAKKLNRKVSSEKLFTIGLFHDCGIPVMAMKYANYHEVLQHAQQSPDDNLVTIEEQKFGVNHATIGYYVASSWRLPVDICQLILRHHDRNFLNKLDNSELQTCFAILKMAENITYQLKYFNASNDWAFLQDTVFTVLDCDEYDYQDLVEDCTEQLALSPT